MARATSFGGRSVIVTGGASGIGYAMATQMVQRGAHVTLADIDGAGVRIAADNLARRTAAAGSATPAEMDVTDRVAVEQLVEEVVAKHGRLDLMFNNAGIAIGGPTHEMSGAHWDLIIGINLVGVVNGVLAAYPQMVKQGHGHIVNTASTAGLAPAVLVAGYSATKHAIVGLSGALRPEAARRGVKVTVLCPGAVDTAILDAEPPPDLPPMSSQVVTGREYMAIAGLTPIPAAMFARAALRGVARNRAMVIAPASARAVWYLQRTSPRLIEVIGRRMARRVDDASGTTDV